MRQTSPTARPARVLLPLATACSLVALSGAPAAAATLAQGSATAVRVSVGGSPTDSGTYRVTRDEGGEKASGSNRPAVSVLTGQDLVTTGTLAQDARTRLEDGRGSSVACAGLAGPGATVVAAGQGSCLSGGGTLALEAATLDLSGLSLVESEVLQGLDEELRLALEPVVGELGPALQEGLSQALAQVGDPGLFLGLGAVQSSCTAGPGAVAAGRADLADAGAYAVVDGTRVDLLSLPASPPPNTRVVTDLGAVSALVREAVRRQLDTALDGVLGPLGPAVDEAAVLDEALAQVGAQLGPLEEELLSIVLNAQTRPAPGAITVTALDASVLPAAAAELGAEALRLELGESSCGPGGAAATPPRPDPRPQPAPPARAEPAPVTPTAVPAGVASADATGADGGLGASGALALAGLVLLAVAAGPGRGPSRAGR